MENNDYRSIDLCLNILHDKIYNPEPKNCYNIPPIIRNDINIHTIKRLERDDWTDIWSGKIEYLGYYNNKWTFKRSSETSFPCTIAIGKYNEKNTNVNDMGRAELINMAMHYIISEIVIVDNLPFYLLPIMNFDIRGNELVKISANIADKIKSKNDDLFFVNVTEHYFHIQTLREFLTDNFEQLELVDWKVLFFHILYALNKLTERLRKFRHNMLNLESIRVYNNKTDAYGKTTRFRIGDKIFNVPNRGFEIKITDYEKSYTSDYIRNKDTYQISENPYYDIHYIFQYIIFITQQNKNTDSAVKQFLADIVPENFRVKREEEFNGLNEAVFDALSTTVKTPIIILTKNNFFSEFIKESINSRMDLSASPVNNNSQNVDRFLEKGNDIRYSDVSLTDISSDEPRLLARNINYDKNKRSYNNRMNKSEIRGSRRINDQNDQDDLFGKIEKSYNQSSRSKASGATNNDGKKNKQHAERDQVVIDDEPFVEEYDDITEDADTDPDLKRLESDMARTLSDATEAGPRPEESFVKMFSRSRRNQKRSSAREEKDNYDDDDDDDDDYSQNRYSDTSSDNDDDDESGRQSVVGTSSQFDSSQMRNLQQPMQRPVPGPYDHILKNLPEGYSGPLPDHMGQLVPDPRSQLNGYSGMTGMPGMPGAPGMPGMPGMQAMPGMPGPAMGQGMSRISGMGGLGAGMFPPTLGSAALPETIPSLEQITLNAGNRGPNQSNNMPMINASGIPQQMAIDPMQGTQGMQGMQGMQGIPRMPGMQGSAATPMAQTLGMVGGAKNKYKFVSDDFFF